MSSTNMSDRMDPVSFARGLRQTSTSWERLLWQIVRNRQINHAKFRRQHPLGPYTGDFYCSEAKLLIECDGKGHFTVEGQQHDEVRDAWMAAEGIKTLRFTNQQIEHETAVVTNQILMELKERMRSRPSAREKDDE